MSLAKLLASIVAGASLLSPFRDAKGRMGQLKRFWKMELNCRDIPSTEGQGNSFLFFFLPRAYFSVLPQDGLSALVERPGSEPLDQL